MTRRREIIAWRGYISLMLLAIDPGTHSGWALFDCLRLTACGLGGESLRRVPSLEGLTDVLIECPRLRPFGEKNPNSILLVARNAGEWSGRLEAEGVEVRYLLPNDWKGSVKKEISHRRILEKLTLDEIEVLVLGCKGLSPRSVELLEGIRSESGLSAADKRANILDAIGLGLFGVGRRA